MARPFLLVSLFFLPGSLHADSLGKSITPFHAKDIAGYGALKQSIMPDGLDAAMTMTDFRDLIAFLASLK